MIAMLEEDFTQVLQALQFDDAPAGGALVIYKDGQEVVNTATGLALPNLPWSSQTLLQDYLLSVWLQLMLRYCWIGMRC